MLSVLLNCYLYLSSVRLPCKFYALLRVIDRFESRRVFKLHLPFLFKLMSFMGHTQKVQVKRDHQLISGIFCCFSFLAWGNPSHEHLTITWNTQHYYTWFIHHTYIFTFQICTYHSCTYIIVDVICCVFCFFCTMSILYICILLFYSLCPVLLLFFGCTVELLSL